MNKRQLKKKTFSVETLLGFNSHKEYKKICKDQHEHNIQVYRNKKVFKEFTDTDKEEISLGWKTEEEIMSEYGEGNKDVRNNRWRTAKKCKRMEKH